MTFKYFVDVVNICKNYLANSLSDFSEIIPKNIEKAYLRLSEFHVPRDSNPGSATEQGACPSCTHSANSVQTADVSEQATLGFSKSICSLC